MQALERAAPHLPWAPGTGARRECAYVRQGTRTVSSKRAVASGAGVAPTCGPTRTAADFRAHLQRTVASDPQATRWHGVVDTLDSPRAASRVRYGAAAAGPALDRGVTGKRGIRKRRRSRAAFLGTPSPRRVCHDTPTHCSWRNPVEMWLGILGRKLLRRGSFTALADRDTPVWACIASDKRTMAKPFRWTYQGKALVA